MKKTAILIYDQFCNFEISVALEMLAMAQKPITIFARSLAPVHSEEGFTVIADQTIDELDLNDYDSLLLPGAMDIESAIMDDCILDFIIEFDAAGMTIGAISIAPILLLKAGLLNGKKFMAGVNPEDLYEEGYTKEELALMIGWDQNLKAPIPDGYLKDGNIITSVSYNFIPFAMAFGREIGIEVFPQSFGYY